jgi:hypothetical protein
METHKKILGLAGKYGREVWFDIHLVDDWVEGFKKDPELHLESMNSRLLDYIFWLGELSQGAKFKVAVLEKNCYTHTIRRALGHAHSTNELLRLEHEIPIICSANCLQPYRQNDNNWDQGFLFFSPSKTWGQPAYYVHQMIAKNFLPLCIRNKTKSPFNSLDVTSRLSDDKGTLVLQVVNLDPFQVETQIEFGSFIPKKSSVEVFELKGELKDSNTPENPEKVKTIKKTLYLKKSEKQITYIFPSYSFTIIRFE